MRTTLPAAAACLGLWLAGPALADVVHLKDGGEIRGDARREGGQVIVRVDGGELRLDASAVARIEEEASALARLARFRRAMAPGAVAPRVQAARWAAGEGLGAEARALWREVVALDPDHTEARGALGHTLRDGRWLTPEEVRVADGWVRYGGQWMPPEAAAKEEAAVARALADKDRRDALARACAAPPVAGPPVQGQTPASTPWTTPWLFGVTPLPGTARFPAPSTPGSVSLGIQTRTGAPGGQVIFGPVPPPTPSPPAPSAPPAPPTPTPASRGGARMTR